MKVELEAFAKVNLSLVVVGERPDGYHELATTFQTIDLSDRLVFEEDDELSLHLERPGTPPGEENLVLRAARVLATATGTRRGARIRLEKRIPVGGGLGGGSSDAAVTLAGLCALWGIPFSPAELQPLAARLGADVPFFLTGGTARGEGRGDRILPLADLSEAAIVLVLPPFSLSTARVFGGLRAARLTGSEDAPTLSAVRPSDLPDRNDLEPAAEEMRPVLAQLREALRSVGALRARLSGSGSTVFGLFEDLEGARLGAANLRGLNAGVGVRVVRTVGRAEYGLRALAWSGQRFSGGGK